MNKILVVGLLLSIFSFISCVKVPEMTIAEIESFTQKSDSELIKNSVSKPWKGENFVNGTIGGSWADTIRSDPKTFNQLIAERDAESAGIINVTLDYLVDYDASSRQWKPHCAFYDIEINKV